MQRSVATAASVARASKPSPGNTIFEPLATQASTASTMPKQWYSGTGMHRLSCSVRCMQSPIARPLLTMLWWVSVAPLGAPVVPLVNWMLIASKQLRSLSGGSASTRVLPDAISCDQLTMPALGSSPNRTTARSSGKRGPAPAAHTPRVCSIPR